MVSLSYFREILSAVAIGLTLISFLPYIRSVKRGTTRPHIFSWIIWGSTTLVVFAAQLADGGGVGAWPIGVSGAVTIYVAGLAWTKKSDITITTADRLFLLAAAPTASASFIMARALGGNSQLAANIIAISTLFSIVTASLGLALLKVYLP